MSETKKRGRKKEQLSVQEKIERILEFEKKLLKEDLTKKERFNFMWKRNKLKRELREAGHELPKDMRDLVQPKLTNFNKAVQSISFVDLVIDRIATNKQYEKKFTEKVKKLKLLKKKFA